MLKLKALFIFAILAFSTNSITYAATNYPVPIHDGNSAEQYVSEDFAQLNATVAVNDQQEDVVYTVAEGDNLYRIALAHDIPLDTLMNENDLTGYVIYPGQELKVTGEEASSVSENENEGDVQEDVVIATNTPTPPPMEPKEEVAPPESEETAKELVVTATAYTAYCTGCSGTTAYGIDLRANPDQKVIAVDPRVIPLGTRVWVEGYGEAIAGDTGGAIKGNKIDVFIPSYDNAIAWGVKTVKLKVLN